jgi:hypothetical protein
LQLQAEVAVAVVRQVAQVEEEMVEYGQILLLQMQVCQALVEAVAEMQLLTVQYQVAVES